MNVTLRRGYFVSALAFIGLVARFQALLPGYAADDYMHFEATTDETYSLVISQGRWGSALLLRVLDLFQLNWAQTYILGSVGLTLALILLITAFMDVLRLKYTLLNGLIFAAALVASYQTEIFTFRSATLNSALAISTAVCSIRVFHGTWGRYSHRLLLSTALLAAGICFYQSVLNFAVLLGLASLVVQASLKHQNVRTLFVALRSSYLFVAFISALAYLLITKTTQLTLDVSSDSRSRLIGADQIGARLEDWLTLLARVFMANEPIAPLALKLLVAVNFIAAFVIATTRRPGAKDTTPFAFGLFKFLLLLVIVLSLTPGLILLFQDWWPVPRVLAHVGLALAVAAAYLSERLSDSQRAWFLPGATTVLVFSLLTTQSIFIDQQKLNQLDASLAFDIASRIQLVDQENHAEEIAISGNFFSHEGRPIATMQGDLNISAFTVDWAKYPLVLSKLSGSRATQAEPNSQAMAERECQVRDSWPSMEAVFVLDKVAVVCLAGQK